MGKGTDRASGRNTTLSSVAKRKGHIGRQQAVPPRGTGRVPATPKGGPRFSFRSQLILKHRAVVAIPITLETLLGVVPLLESQELRHLRVGSEHLLFAGPPVVSQKVTAAMLKRAIDDVSELALGFLNSLGRMLDMKVKDSRSIALLGPGKETFSVLFNESDGSIHHVGIVLPEVFAQKESSTCPWGHKFR